MSEPRRVGAAARLGTSDNNAATCMQSSLLPTALLPQITARLDLPHGAKLVPFSRIMRQQRTRKLDND